MHMSVNRIVCSVLGRVNVVDVNDKLLSNLYLSDTGLISRRWFLIAAIPLNTPVFRGRGTESLMAQANSDHI